MLELRGVTKSYGKKPALRPTDLFFPARQTTVLIGPSGCGKATLLRLLLGLLWPDDGVVTFEGVELSPANVLMLRQRIGYVIHDGGLFPHLTARGNITLMARYLGWGKGRLEKRLQELAQVTRF